MLKPQQLYEIRERMAAGTHTADDIVAIFAEVELFRKLLKQRNAKIRELESELSPNFFLP